MDGGEELRIVLLGKSGVGKSAVGNTILGENVFKENSIRRGITFCQREEKVINGRTVVVIDTPGIFDTDLTEKEVQDEVISCLVECAPGPHVFILVIKVDRHIQESHQTVKKLLKYFSDDVVHHVVLLFTHGDDLNQNKTIHYFINQSDVEGKKSGKQSLKDLAERCGNRVHVIDNKYWKENRRVSGVLATLRGLNLTDQATREITEKMMLTPADKTPWFNVLSDVGPEHGDESVEQSRREYRTNRYQLTQLMKSVKNILRENKGQHYSNETLVEIKWAIDEELKNILQEMKEEDESVNTGEIRRRAMEKVRASAREGLPGVATGTLAVLAAPVVFVAGHIRAAWRRLTHQ